MVKKSIESSSDLVKSIAGIYKSALSQPDKAVEASASLMQEMFRSFAGNSDVKPERGDKRFADPIWNSNPFYKTLMESYINWSQGMNGWVDSLDLDERAKLRAKLLTGMVVDTLAPTNTLLGNPAAMKTTFEKGGANLLAGAKHLIQDMVENGGLPSTVDKSEFTVGENLAVTAGEVIYREEHLELIQYKAATATVHKRPIFITPPQINKFYVWDLAPGRSVVEYLVNQGFQVFLVSWRNPNQQHADWGMDTYVSALDRASEVACQVSNSSDLNLVGACSGGITTALLMAYWASKRVKRAKSFTLLVAILDVAGAKDTTMGLFANFETLELARMFSKSKGVLPGKDLQKAFAWLRPNDLIWAYWVNNYLHGNEPPVFDILFWNADTTNLPAALHQDMLDLMAQGGLSGGSEWNVNGQSIDLKDVNCDKFILGGTTDHITPWDGCYSSMKAFGGSNEFVLSKSGHIQTIINPPGNPKAVFMTNTGAHSTPEEFLENSKKNDGTWWEYWVIWLKERSGEEVKAPESLGSTKHGPIEKAPGSYVFEEIKVSSGS